MKDPNTHIDDFFKEGLEGYSETPPPAVWDALEKRLDGKKDRKGFGWFWPIAILSFMTLFGGTVAWKLNSNSNIAGTEIKTAKNNVPVEEKATTSNIEKQVAGNIISEESAKTNTDAISKKAEPVKELSTTKAQTNKIPTASQNIAHETPAQSSHTDNTTLAVNEKPTTENKKAEESATTNEVSKAGKAAEAPAKENIVPDMAVAKPASQKQQEKPEATSVAKKIDAKVTEVTKPVTPKPTNATTTEVIKPTTTAKTSATVAKHAAVPAKSSEEVKEKIVPASKLDEGKVAAPKTVATIKQDAKAVIKPVAVAKIPVKKAPLTKVIPTDVAKADVVKDNQVDKAKVKEEKTTVAEPVAKKAVKTKLTKAPVVSKTMTPKPAKPEDKPVLRQVPANEANGSEPVAKLNNEPLEKGPKQPAEPVYNSTTNTAAKEIVKENKVVAEAPKPVEQKVISTFKEEKPLAMNSASGSQTFTNAAAASPANVGVDTGSTGGHNNRWQMGIKGGFETGATKNASNKFVVSPFAEISLSKKFSLLFQPSLNISKAYNRVLNGNQSFYSKNLNSNSIALDSVVVPDSGGISGYSVHYVYSQTHDSIAKTYSTGGAYYEFQLPISIKYKISQHLSVYGGVSLSYSKYIAIKENNFDSKPITITSYSDPVFVPLGSTNPQPKPIDSVINYSGKPISAYSGPLYSSQNGDLWRLGYMLGFSYEFKQRWIFDVLVQQSHTSSNVQGGIDINSPFSLPYLRITLGYKLGSIPIKFLK